MCFRLEGAEHISPGNRSGGSRHRRGGHAATARRSARVSRPRRLARPTGLPRSSQTQVSEVFVLAELTPNEGDLSVKHLGGVRRPAPSAGSCLGRGQESLHLRVLPGNRDMVRVRTDHIPIQETRAQRGRVPGWRTTNNCATPKLARRVGTGTSAFHWLRRRLAIDRSDLPIIYADRPPPLTPIST